MVWSRTDHGHGAARIMGNMRTPPRSLGSQTNYHKGGLRPPMHVWLITCNNGCPADDSSLHCNLLSSSVITTHTHDVESEIPMEPLPSIPGPAPGPVPPSTIATAVRSASTPSASSASSSVPPRRILSCVCQSGPLPPSFSLYTHSPNLALPLPQVPFPDQGITDPSSGSCRRDASTARSAVPGLSLVRLVYRSVLALSIVTFPLAHPTPLPVFGNSGNTHTPVLLHQFT